MIPLRVAAGLTWHSGPSVAAPELFEEASKGRNTTYLRMKRHILDALEVQAPALVGQSAETFWRAGSSVLDVGAGTGEIGLYLQSKYELVCSGVDVVKPEANKYAMGRKGDRREFLPIEIFDGASLPVPSGSKDVVLFNAVLHHAANNTLGLVKEAARVARRFIVVLEDLHVPGHHGIDRRNFDHDPNGIFRTLWEWLRLFRNTPGVKDVRHDMLCQHLDDTKFPCKSNTGVSNRIFYVVFVNEVQNHL